MSSVGTGATAFATGLVGNVGFFSVTRPAVSSVNFLIQRKSAQCLQGEYDFHELCNILAAHEFVIQPITAVIVSNCGICLHRYV
jgi:hypothetical protein